MIDSLKRANLVEIMKRHWGVEFTREGNRYLAYSPFRDEKKPSFYVTQQDDGHWVFFDHGSGEKGSLIDAVMAYEGHQDIKQAIELATRMVQEAGLIAKTAQPESLRGKGPCGKSKQDLDVLLGKLENHPTKAARDYLIGRGIAANIVDRLLVRGLIVLNKIHKSDYCSFVIDDAAGEIKALFNRKISGPANRNKFLLGQQFPFCPDWGKLSKATVITICESIIDALSFQTMNPDSCVIALPSVSYKFGQFPELPAQVRLIDAFDNDQAGRNASKRLKQNFPDAQITRLELHGKKDVNELLTSGKWKEVSEELVPGAPPMSETQIPESSRRMKLSLDDRIAIALSDKPSRTLAQQYGVHHSQICNIRNDATHILKEVWSQRRPGRKPKPRDSTEVLELKNSLKEVQTECDMRTIRQEWLELLLMQNERRLVDMTKREKAREAKKNGKRGPGND